MIGILNAGILLLTPDFRCTGKVVFCVHMITVDPTEWFGLKFDIGNLWHLSGNSKFG
jgi:hypothetical protein